MADQPEPKDLFPSSLEQNPSAVDAPSQDRITKVRSQVSRIMEVFRQVIPSNYVSQVQGPFYTLQFQAAAEAMAEIQISSQEIFSDQAWVYTRPEFLWQLLGILVFPDGQADGIPTINGDLSYREFLRRMVQLLLKGATKESVQGGIELLTTADVEIIERGVVRRQLGELSGWGPGDHYTFEINLSRQVEVVNEDLPSEGAPGVPESPDEDTPLTEEGRTTTLYAFPEEDLGALQKNIDLVLTALKPAHILYDLRYLFRDVFQGTVTDKLSWELDSYYYEDLRRYCLGAKNITGSGDTLTNRSLFTDTFRSFRSVRDGAELTIQSGLNAGRYKVVDVLYFPYGDDPVPRSYTTSGGLSGTATVSGGAVEDTSQNFGQALEGEVLTFTTGPNAGSYRLDTLLGLNGGPVGISTGPATRVRVSPAILRIYGRMPQAATGQPYTVTVDRLGVLEPRVVEGEDVSETFYL